MSYEINEKLLKQKAYQVEQLNYSIRLDANESPFNPANLCRDELIEAFSDIKLNRYPESDSRELREAFAKCYNIPPESIIAGNGSDELLGLLIGTVLSKDERLLIFEPDFSMYKIYAESFEKDIVSIKKTDSINFNEKFLEEQINKFKPDMIMFSNPRSPFGTLIKRETVLKMADAADKKGCLLVIDEAYMDFSDQSILSDVYDSNNLIVLRTLSKAWGLAGLRLGFLIAPVKLANVVNTFRPPYNVNAVSQAIGKIVLSHPEHLEESVKKIIELREGLYEQIKKHEDNKFIKKIWKSEANYIYIETNKAREITDAFHKHQIQVRGLENAIRITIGTEQEHIKLIKALDEILPEL